MTPELSDKSTARISVSQYVEAIDTGHTDTLGNFLWTHRHHHHDMWISFVKLLNVSNVWRKVKFTVKFISMEYADYVIRSNSLKVVHTSLVSTSEDHRKSSHTNNSISQKRRLCVNRQASKGRSEDRDFRTLYVFHHQISALVRSRGEMYIGHGRLSVGLSVWLSAAVRPHYCTDPDVTSVVVGDAP